jgi:uncharacterized protein (TIGR03083 family)
MSNEGMAGLRATMGDISALLSSLDDSEWETLSAATGWTVKDVVTHMGDLLGILIAAMRGELDAAPGTGIERLNDADVAARSTWSPAQVTADLKRQAGIALPMFEAVQAGPAASSPAQLLDLGTYPVHAISDMFAFDFYTHLRWDILGPRGPLIGHAVPAPDSVRLTPAVGWLLAGLPKMQAGIRGALAKPVTLALTGPGGGDWQLDPSDELIAVTPADPQIPTAARIESSTHAFTAWATTRLPWRDHATVTGDMQTAATFLDALNLV